MQHHTMLSYTDNTDNIDAAVLLLNCWYTYCCLHVATMSVYSKSLKTNLWQVASISNHICAILLKYRFAIWGGPLGATNALEAFD